GGRGMKILMVGGGSGGPVAPLLAVAEEIKKAHTKADFLFIGTAHGPEVDMVQRAGFTFTHITAGKFRRYFSWKNFVAPFLVLLGFLESLKIVKRFKPDCVFATGSFVQVPVLWAAWILKVPVVIHQQDVLLSLANKLCSWIAARVTVTFESSLNDFSNGL